MPAALRALRQIGREAIIAIGTKDAGIDVRVAVAPEAEAIAPDRIVIHVIVSEGPEQRTDPAITTTRMLPPPAAGAMPANQSRRSRNLDPRRRVAEQAAVTQGTGMP